MQKRRRSLADLLGDPPTPEPKKRGRPVEPHRVRLATAQAELAEIRAAKMRGELVSIADVEREWASIITDVRQRLLAVPSRVGAKPSLRRVDIEVIDAEIRATLTALVAQEGVTDAYGPS